MLHRVPFSGSGSRPRGRSRLRALDVYAVALTFPAPGRATGSAAAGQFPISSTGQPLHPAQSGGGWAALNQRTGLATTPSRGKCHGVRGARRRRPRSRPGRSDPVRRGPGRARADRPDDDPLEQGHGAAQATLRRRGAQPAEHLDQAQGQKARAAVRVHVRRPRTRSVEDGRALRRRAARHLVEPAFVCAGGTAGAPGDAEHDAGGFARSSWSRTTRRPRRGTRVQARAWKSRAWR